MRTRKINEEIGTTLNRLDMKLSSTREPFDILAGYTTIVNIRAKYEDIVQGRFDQSTKYSLCFQFATRVIILWWLILSRTHAGHTKPEQFPFDQFVLAALMIMTDGFELPDPFVTNGNAPKIQLVCADKVTVYFYDATNLVLGTSAAGHQQRHYDLPANVQGQPGRTQAQPQVDRDDAQTHRDGAQRLDL